MSEQLNLFNTCVLYVRISTTLDSQLTSLENQEFDLRRWADANHLKILDVYQDTCSGSSMDNREGLQSAIKRANETGSTILITELSRLTRSLKDLCEMLDANTKFIITTSGRQLSKEMLLIMGVFAEATRDTISRSTSRGIQAKFARDEEARTEWGAQRYKEHTAEAMTQGRKKSADEFALENGEFAYLMRANGMSFEDIATTYTAQAKYKTQRGKKTWTKSGIRKVILRYTRLIQEAKC